MYIREHCAVYMRVPHLDHDIHPPDVKSKWRRHAEIRTPQELHAFCAEKGWTTDGSSRDGARVHFRCKKVAKGCRARALYLRERAAVYRRVAHNHNHNAATIVEPPVKRQILAHGEIGSMCHKTHIQNPLQTTFLYSRIHTSFSKVQKILTILLRV